MTSDVDSEVNVSSLIWLFRLLSALVILLTGNAFIKRQEPYILGS